MEEKLSDTQRNTLRCYIDERDEALRRYWEVTSWLAEEQKALHELDLASERLRAYRETL